MTLAQIPSKATYGQEIQYSRNVASAVYSRIFWDVPEHQVSQNHQIAQGVQLHKGYHSSIRNEIVAASEEGAALSRRLGQADKHVWQELSNHCDDIGGIPAL